MTPPLTPEFKALKDKAPHLASADFPDTEVSNGHGMCGELSATSVCGQFRLSASLSSDNPDSADEDLRAQKTLSVHLRDQDEHELYAFEGMAYEYHGDDLGDHLDDLLRQGPGGLLNMLFDEVFATGSSCQ